MQQLLTASRFKRAKGKEKQSRKSDESRIKKKRVAFSFVHVQQLCSLRAVSREQKAKKNSRRGANQESTKARRIFLRARAAANCGRFQNQTIIQAGRRAGVLAGRRACKHSPSARTSEEKKRHVHTSHTSVLRFLVLSLVCFGFSLPCTTKRD